MCFFLFRARVHPFVRSSSSSSFIDARAIRFESVRFDSTRHARGHSRAVLARARADVRLVATTRRDVIGIGIIIGGIRVDRARARETRWTREEARDGGGWVSIRCGRACESERERERETRRDDGG